MYCIYINATTTTIATVDNYNHNYSNDNKDNPMESKILTDRQIVSSRQVQLSCSLSIILNQLIGIFQIVQCAGPKSLHNSASELLDCVFYDSPTFCKGTNITDGPASVTGSC